MLPFPTRTTRILHSFLKVLNIFRLCQRPTSSEASRSSSGSKPADNIENLEGQVIGPYKLISELDRGTFAAVYYCQHIHTQRSYAAKFYSLEWIRTEIGMDIIDKELHIMKLLDHRNTIFFQDVIFTKDGILIVMELVQGKILLDILPQGDGVLESFARQIFVQLLDGLEYLHQRRIVHRDIKLENVMIDFEGTVKIIDYGMAKHVSRDRSKTRSLLVDERCGSKNYFAPEIYTSEGDEFRGDITDIWAAGVLLFALVNGKFPFHHDDDEEMKKEILNCESWVKDWMGSGTKISPELKDVFRRIFVSDPEKRPSIDDLKRQSWTQGTKLSSKDHLHEFSSTSGRVVMTLVDRKVERSNSCDFVTFSRGTRQSSRRIAIEKKLKIRRSSSSPNIQFQEASVDEARTTANGDGTEGAQPQEIQGRRRKLRKGLRVVCEIIRRIFGKTWVRKDRGTEERTQENQASAPNDDNVRDKRVNVTMVNRNSSRGSFAQRKRRRVGSGGGLANARDSLLPIATAR